MVVVGGESSNGLLDDVQVDILSSGMKYLMLELNLQRDFFSFLSGA